MSVSLDHVQEIQEGLVTAEVLRDDLATGKAVLLKGVRKSVAVGTALMVKVNTSVGCSTSEDLERERAKVSLLGDLAYGPDTMMDLSIVRLARPLYSYAIEEFGGPVGTLPHYVCYEPRGGIDSARMLEEIERQAAAGVSWMTLHLTVRRDLYDLAQLTRRTPVTARGGGLVVRDMFAKGKSEGVLAANFPAILDILGRYDVVLSLGTTFRPANVVEALDPVHRAEIELQGTYIREARRRGVPVMLEGVGHMTLNRIPEYIALAGAYGIPMVPLGPIPTDAAVGEDHIASAIGAAYMALLGGADLVNSVTREEHTGGVPTSEAILEGLRAARIAAHSVNVARFPSLDVADRETADMRAASYTCVVEGGLFSRSSRSRFAMGCSRCGPECPLLVNYVRDKRLGLIRKADDTTP